MVTTPNSSLGVASLFCLGQSLSIYPHFGKCVYYWSSSVFITDAMQTVFFLFFFLLLLDFRLRGSGSVVDQAQPSHALMISKGCELCPRLPFRRKAGHTQTN